MYLYYHLEMLGYRFPCVKLKIQVIVQVHRIPPARLKCVSEKRINELADMVRANAYSLTVTVLTSVYCWRPYSPSSRPIPDCLKPPNGAAASNTS